MISLCFSPPLMNDDNRKKHDINRTSGNGNTPLGPTFNHYTTLLLHLVVRLTEYISTHPLLTHRLRH
jgi:hypothetical protein